MSPLLIARSLTFVGIVIAMLVTGQNVPGLDSVPATSPEARLQGEYSGRVRDWGGYTGRIGIQVRAVGGGRLEAVVYRGGLPRDGWDRKTRWTASGTIGPQGARLEGETPGVLELTMEPRAFAWAIAADGRRVGGLLRIDRRSPTLGLRPESEAEYLFHEGRITGLIDAQLSAEGNLAVGSMTEKPVQDFRLHLEFRLPLEPDDEGQGRGNSGIYIQRRYEIQILDSFGLEAAFDGCGAIYRQRPASTNACLPPMSWQTYDIQFRAARWNEAGERTEPARVTVDLNGVRIHQDQAIETKTGAGQPEAPHPLPLLLQNHSDAVEFRNVWIEHQ